MTDVSQEQAVCVMRISLSEKLVKINQITLFYIPADN
jgi:hypothetical protein